MAKRMTSHELRAKGQHTRAAKAEMREWVMRLFLSDPALLVFVEVLESKRGRIDAKDDLAQEEIASPWGRLPRLSVAQNIVSAGGLATWLR